MNKHIFVDNITASIGALISGKKKFFAKSVQSASFEEQVAGIELELDQLSGEGIYEMHAKTLAGELDPAFRVAQWKGNDSPTIIYHHGNNERPFDFKKSAKNTFYNIFFNNKEFANANLIVVRAPFHNSSLKHYQDSMIEINNFIAMIATSVKLNEKVINAIRKKTSKPIITSGISLGGWVTNLHRGIYNTSTAYAPLMAGAYLGELFLESKYSKMASNNALEHPEAVRKLLNFDELFNRQNTKNVYPLLSRHDQFIEYNIQKETYKEHQLTTIECGHVTGALSAQKLSTHLQSILKRVDQK